MEQEIVLGRSGLICFVVTGSPMLTRLFLDRMTLARREMALVLSAIMIKYDVYKGQEGPTMELYETDRSRDVAAHRDYIIPIPAEGSEGVRIKFRA